ncbi:hypothetical protein [Variovorax sp. UMC13]|uniref:hypothetical protein n=1 Tax=Variovorax sp. UMC13 TaxID=1862326 RepID=UPI0015FFCCDF|nr:hypothetical protein [Variovorax sp. UMC13]
MSIATNSGFNAVASSPVLAEMALVELFCRFGTPRYTTWPMNVEARGHTWQGVGNLGSIGEVHESEDGAEEKLNLTLSAVDLGTRALALGDPNDYQDRPMRLYVAMVNVNTYQLSGEPVMRFAGVMDTLDVGRDGTSGTITLKCRTASYDRRNNPSALRMNNAQHQARHPGERGFEYLTSLIGNQAVWVSKRLQAELNARLRAKG